MLSPSRCCMLSPSRSWHSLGYSASSLLQLPRVWWSVGWAHVHGDHQHRRPHHRRHMGAALGALYHVVRSHPVYVGVAASCIDLAVAILTTSDDMASASHLHPMLQIAHLTEGLADVEPFLRC